MAEARFNQVGVDIERGRGRRPAYGLRATGQTLMFDGFRRVYFEGRDDAADEDAEAALPALTAEQLLRMLEVLPEQHFTQPPPRFTEASLVKTLEELGIGRPVDVRVDHLDDPGPRVRPPRGPAVLPRGRRRGRDRQAGRALPRHRRRRTSRRRWRRSSTRSPRADLRWVQVLRRVLTDRSSARSRRRRTSSSATSRSSTRTARSARGGARARAACRSSSGRYGKFIGCRELTRSCKYIRNLDGQERPEPEMLDETCPECGRRSSASVGRFGPFVGCSGLPGLPVHQEGPADSRPASRAPSASEGEIVEKRTRFGAVLRVRPLPRLRLRREQPADRRITRAPSAARSWSGGRRRSAAGAAAPSSIWTFNVTKPGDAEAEAEVRAAKAARPRAAKAARERRRRRTAKKKTAARKKSDGRGRRPRKKTRREAEAHRRRIGHATTEASREG